MRNLFLEKKQTGVLIFKENCPVDIQFSGPRQCNYSSVLGKVLIAQNSGVSGYFGLRNADLSFYSKISSAWATHIDSDTTHLYGAGSGEIHKMLISTTTTEPPIAQVSIASIRMIDAQSDPDYVYVTSNNATDGHGVRKVRKSDMTVVASLLATGSGNGQFNNPLGVKKYGDYVYVCDTGNHRIVKLLASDLSFVAVYSTGLSSVVDIATDGSYWYVGLNNTIIHKYDMNFDPLVPAVNLLCSVYSLCLIPDQSDGNGATLCVVSNTNSNIKRHKCSDLSLITTVGSSGTGADTLCDPQVTGPAGIWYDSEDNSYSVASGANISKNGFSGTFFRGSPGWMRYRPVTGGLLSITAIDFSDDKISGEIRNLYKCINLTSLKLQTNPMISLNLSKLPVKLQTIWAYACGAGVFGSIRHMTSATSINLRENGASQVLVDQWIDDLWQNRDVMAVATVNLNGSNAAPSGVYQDATPPTTGLEKVFDLVENCGWTVATT